ncbi:MAG TPA: hypothetical protein VFF54_07545 [Thermodesulfobacteriota bacterium]|nr:hypothetical protein [Thermodesulfobacteriota bacterium]
MLVSVLSAIGFMLAVMSFMGGFRMVKKTDEHETFMHRLNGYMTIACYLTIAVLSIAKAPHASSIALWFLGLSLHGLKVFIARIGLAVRYGGYFGATLIITWFVVIFTHLPS